MLPNAVTLRNYRSFAEPVHFEMRPVTLLYGVNNAGKSALLRALPLLADSLGDDVAGPLNLESPAMRGGSFADLRWKGPPAREDADSHLGVSFHWRGEDGPTSVDFVLEWLGGRLFVQNLSLQGPGEVSLALKWKALKKEQADESQSYEVRIPEGLGLCKVTFRGLLPHSGDARLDALLAGLRDRLRGLYGRVQWLGATRRLPEARHGVRPSGPKQRMRADGEDVGAVLASQPEVLAQVSSWYERHLKRRVIVADVPPGSYRLMLMPLERASFDVDLRDTGEGMVQVLPTLTALALACRAEGAGQILALEEPESHLHPALQRALSEEICAVAGQSPPRGRPRILLETHSEHFVLAVQLQILQNKIDPDDVLIYWVRQLDNGESVVERMGFDRRARFVGGTLPSGVFSEDTDMARAVIRARMELEKP
jgi:predicted ATPase